MDSLLLAADLEDWVRVIVILIFFLGPLLNWLGGNAGKAKQQRRLPQMPPRPPGRPGQQQQPGQPQPMGQGRQALEREIEDFLKQAQRGGQQQAAQRPEQRPLAQQGLAQQRPAQQRPAQQPAQQRPQARPAQQRPPARAQQLKPQRLQGQRQAPPQQPPAQPQPIQRRPLGDEVGQHVREHIESHPVTEHGKQLGRRVAQADENVEQHIHDVFDHNLGQLQKSDVFQHTAEGTDAAVWQTTERAPTRAQDLLELFRDPQSIRDAIVLTEVFKRPLGMDDKS